MIPASSRGEPALSLRSFVRRLARRRLLVPPPPVHQIPKGTGKETKNLRPQRNKCGHQYKSWGLRPGIVVLCISSPGNDFPHHRRKMLNHPKDRQGTKSHCQQDERERILRGFNTSRSISSLAYHLHRSRTLAESARRGTWDFECPCIIMVMMTKMLITVLQLRILQP